MAWLSCCQCLCFHPGHLSAQPQDGRAVSSAPSHPCTFPSPRSPSGHLLGKAPLVSASGEITPVSWRAALMPEGRCGHGVVAGQLVLGPLRCLLLRPCPPGSSLQPCCAWDRTDSTGDGAGEQRLLGQRRTGSTQTRRAGSSSGTFRAGNAGRNWQGLLLGPGWRCREGEVWWLRMRSWGLGSGVAGVPPK